MWIKTTICVHHIRCQKPVNANISCPTGKTSTHERIKENFSGQVIVQAVYQRFCRHTKKVFPTNEKKSFIFPVKVSTVSWIQSYKRKLVLKKAYLVLIPWGCIALICIDLLYCYDLNCGNAHSWNLWLIQPFLRQYIFF